MENIDLFEEKLILRNLSERTIKSYVANILMVSKLLNKPPGEITEYDLRGYVVSKKKRTLSSSSQMMVINSFKAYYREVFDRNFDHSILPRPKMDQKQPDILSVEEMQKVINVITNLKHKAIVCLMYSVALRVGEIINLRINDIDSKNHKINIKNSKGKVDRIVMLDESIVSLLREYWHVYHTKEFLFTGSKGGKYSETSVQTIIKTATKKAGINKNISSHSLRHSCLTQLIKNGVDLRSVQKIAGHKNINTTAGYIKLIDSDILSTESPIKLIKI